MFFDINCCLFTIEVKKFIYQHFGQRCYKNHEKSVFQIPKCHSERTFNFGFNGISAKLCSNEISRGFFCANPRNSYGH